MSKENISEEVVGQIYVNIRAGLILQGDYITNIDRENGDVSWKNLRGQTIKTDLETTGDVGTFANSADHRLMTSEEASELARGLDDEIRTLKTQTLDLRRYVNTLRPRPDDLTQAPKERGSGHYHD